MTGALGQMTDSSRWEQLPAVMVHHGVRFARGGLLIVPGVVLLRAWRSSIRLQPRGRAVPVAFAATQAVFFTGVAFVYLLSPFDVDEHASWSLSRLLLQAWPAFLFVVLGLAPWETQGRSS